MLHGGAKMTNIAFDRCEALTKADKQLGDS